MGPNGEMLMTHSTDDAIEADSKFDGKITVEYAFQSLEDFPASFYAPEDRTKRWGKSGLPLL